MQHTSPINLRLSSTKPWAPNSSALANVCPIFSANS